MLGSLTPMNSILLPCLMLNSHFLSPINPFEYRFT